MATDVNGKGTLISEELDSDKEKPLLDSNLIFFEKGKYYLNY